ncbi:MAG: catalase/peroxidase HPI [Acidimicrobiales bacterium]|nr:catalase/peroxidase HPI [Acidimicrobiales bacterium]RZV48268.1 MAG: catalase/peroxidase HPI [Acidimicrobiales bacterium]
MSTDEGKCPVAHNPHTGTGSSANQHWWPNQLNLNILDQGSSASNPMGDDFDYAAEHATLDLPAVKADLTALMTDSQDWWPADFGHYGGLFVRMAWHSAGTYRTHDGRGGGGSGTQRFAPLNSWPDNGNLDKARQLLLPIKQKYGRKLSWADLMILAGNVAMESMGFKTYGFAGGREDVWAPEEDIYWGPENVWLDDERYSGDRELMEPLGAVQMGLIYVNPEGPNAVPDPVASGRDVRETFRRMAMNDEETVALVAGGHAFGKMHGAGPEDDVAAEPEGAPMEQQLLGWKNSYESGKAEHTTTAGFEGAWNSTPTTWDNNYLETLMDNDWELMESPSGHKQWTAPALAGTVPDAHVEGLMNGPVMTTADMSLKMDPIYNEISTRFRNDFDAFSDAYARAWYKLTHRDMGPKVRYVGPEVPAADELWQDPIPAGTALSDADVATVKAAIMGAGLSITDLVSTAWASASTYRGSDMRGGANGARIRLEPQVSWEANNPADLRRVLTALEGVQSSVGVDVSMADLIVLGGAAAIEAAASAAGQSVSVAVSTGRGDATQDQTDVESFAWLEPKADGFRNYLGKGVSHVAEHLLVDKAQLLGLSAPEMTVLVGGLRTLGVSSDNHGVLTDDTSSLTNDFFVNLLDVGTEWSPASGAEGVFEGKDRASGAAKGTGTRNDLVFGSNSILRALAEVYGSSDSAEKFANDFAAAFAKVMDADRFDL